jgi:EmrB/QacA subfamily drug resistance transporter
MSTEGVAVTAKPGMSTKRIALVASILGSGIVFLDGTIVNVALPAIRADLSGTLADQQWVVEAYLLTLGSLLLVGGSLGDLFGRRRVFSIGLVGFGVCSLLCAVAPSTEFLIFARGVQGIAGALLVPSTLALIMDTFDEDERAAAIGTWTAWTGVATVIGPLGGGALIQGASWRWIFAINLVPVAITLFLLTRIAPDHRTPGHVDVVGAILCALGLGGPVFALIEQPQYGWGDPRVVIPLIGGLVLLVAFVLWERGSPQPMMPLDLFKIRNFSVGNLTTLTLYAGLGVATFFLVLFIQQVGGYTPIEAGLSLLPITIMMFLLSRRFGALADRVGPHLFMGGGPIVAGLGLLLLARTNASADYITQILPGVLVFGLGLSMTVAPLTATVLSSVEPGHSGLASGVNNAVARIAGLLAIAALGAVVSSAFQSRLDHDINPSRLAPNTRAAVATARQRPLVTDVSGVPVADRTEVHTALDDASVHAFRIGMGVGAGLAVLGGVVALIGIENPRRRVRCADCQPPAVSTTGATLSAERESTAAGATIATEPG